ncbi:MAG TPA: hypothetical protein VHB97_02240 [Polyangia bacterium]|jgi:hypothetical protein|nr:hypothetical protein [Polyangia bacterium]
MRAVSLIALISLLLFSAGCPAAHDDYPGLACKANSDCYVGELCNSGGICVPNMDMSIEGDFAHLPFDFSGTDIMPSDDLTPEDM